VLDANSALSTADSIGRTGPNRAVGLSGWGTRDGNDADEMLGNEMSCVDGQAFKILLFTFQFISIEFILYTSHILLIPSELLRVTGLVSMNRKPKQAAPKANCIKNCVILFSLISICTAWTYLIYESMHRSSSAFDVVAIPAHKIDMSKPPDALRLTPQPVLEVTPPPQPPGTCYLLLATCIALCCTTLHYTVISIIIF
jgi:hypothetical protein